MYASYELEAVSPSDANLTIIMAGYKECKVRHFLL